MEFAEKRD